MRIAVFTIVAICFLVDGPQLAAQAQPGAAAQPAAQPAAKPIRKLAPGVLKSIRPEPLEEETITGPIALVELMTPAATMNWTPGFTPKTNTLFEKAKAVTLHRSIWNLEFSFKSVRMINVDIPQPTGKFQRRLIWYVVYRVRNPGYELQPEESEDQWGLKTYPKVSRVQKANLRFYPHMVLTGTARQADGSYARKEYLDRVIPVAWRPIQEREFPQGPRLYNSVEMSTQSIAQGESKWGFAAWEIVDPRVDYFSIYVKGLTNAFRVVNTSDGRRAYTQKALQLNFWRPGDVVYEHEREVRYGIPAVADPAEQARILSHYGLKERVDHRWVYR